MCYLGSARKGRFLSWMLLVGIRSDALFLSHKYVAIWCQSRCRDHVLGVLVSVYDGYSFQVLLSDVFYLVNV